MEEWGGPLKAPSEILEDRIHTIQINLWDGPSKPSSEIVDGFVLRLNMVCKELIFPFYRTEHRYWETNAAHNALNELIDLHGSLWNQARAGPFKLVGNTLHSKRSLPVLSIIAWLKCSVIIRIGGAIIHGKRRYNKATGLFVAQDMLA